MFTFIFICFIVWLVIAIIDSAVDNKDNKAISNHAMQDNNSLSCNITRRFIGFSW